MNNEIPFGLMGSRLYHVDEVARGDKCGCLCPKCNTPLRANHGEKKNHYFSHKPGADCKGALETSLHLAAKQVLEEIGEICLPPHEVKVSVQANDEVVYSKSGTLIDDYKIIPIDSVRMEQRIGNVQPDITLTCQGHSLFVEVAVTHFVDEIKRERIIKLGQSCIEIDLSDLSRNSKWDDIKKVIRSGKNTKWINNIAEERLKEHLRKELVPVIKTANFEHVKREKEKQVQRLKKQREQENVDKALEEYQNFRLLEVQRSIRTQLALKVEQHPLWEPIQHKLNVTTLDDVPSHLFAELDHDLMFQCDPRIWQMSVVLGFIYKKRGVSNYIDVRDVSSWLNKKMNLKPYWFYSTLGIARSKGYKIEDQDDPVVSNWNVLENYLDYLMDRGYLRTDLRRYFVIWDKLELPKV